MNDLSGEYIDYRLRNVYVRNMYVVLTVVHGLLLFVTTLFTYFENANSFLGKNSWLIFPISLFIYVVVFFSFCCCRESVGRKSPWNYLLLLVMYSALGVVSACLVQVYDSKFILLIIFYVFAAVLAVVVFITLLPCDKYLFKYLLCVMWTITGTIWIVTYILTFAFMYAEFRPGQLLFGFVVGLIYSSYLALHTQHIMSSQTTDLSVDEYGASAIILVTDIVNISLCMLSVLDASD